LQIDHFFLFEDDPVEEIKIGAKPDDFPAYRIRGKLDDTKIKSLLKTLGIPETAGAQAMPPHIPTEIVMEIGKEDLFPYHLEYFGQSRGKSLPLLELRLEDVQYDGDLPLSPSVFSYSPGEKEFLEDITEDYIDSLRLE